MNDLEGELADIAREARVLLGRERRKGRRSVVIEAAEKAAMKKGRR